MEFKVRRPFKLDIPCCFLIAALFAAGLFHDFAACAALVFLCGYLLVLVVKNKEFVFRVNITSIAVLVIGFFYLISILWAVDSGMAFIGFIKILPLPLFMLVIMQKSESKRRCIEVLPVSMAVMTVISAIVVLFSPRNEFFAPAGRLSGFLQYSNTFALLLLVSVVIIASKEKHSAADYMCLPALIVGIILSGSRTVFILTILAVLVLIFISKNKKLKIFLGSITVLTTVAAVIYVLVTENLDSIGRFLSVSFAESTFVGRLLY